MYRKQVNTKLSAVVDYMKKVYVEVLHHSSYIKLNLTLAIEKGRYLLIM